MFFDTLLTPIDIWLFYSVLFIPVQKGRLIIAVATKANIALLTTATHRTFADITPEMWVHFLLTLDTLHLDIIGEVSLNSSKIGKIGKTQTFGSKKNTPPVRDFAKRLSCLSYWKGERFSNPSHHTNAPNKSLYR